MITRKDPAQRSRKGAGPVKKEYNASDIETIPMTLIATTGKWRTSSMYDSPCDSFMPFLRLSSTTGW